MAIVLKGHIHVPKEDLPLVKAHLGEHIRLTRDESGCLEFRVTQDQGDPLRFSVFERFRDKESFNLHQRRVENSEWGHVTKNVTRTYVVLDDEDGLKVVT
jgi:autoinducer 2-degrading protein